VRIQSRDAKDSPKIQLNYLSTEKDVRTLLEGSKIVRRIGQAEPLKRFGAQELRPGPDIRDDDGLLAYIRQNCSTAFHYSGTARMGIDDMAVVDPTLKVRGVDKLRVIDASVMPTIVSGNTNGATIMIAEKGADFIKQG
jgi:choline dehydrogenase